MTVFVKTALCAALAATLSLAIAPTTVAAKSRTATSNINITMKRGSFAVHPPVPPTGLTAGTQSQSAGQNNTFCGKGDVFVIYDEDARTETVFPAPNGTAAPTEGRIHDMSNLRPVCAGRRHFGSALTLSGH